MKVIVTGSAGFIGSALSIKLTERGDQVISIDNHNDYYDPALKEASLARYAKHENYTHLCIDIANRELIGQTTRRNKPRSPSRSPLLN
jgi:UDP-glucuronate 4-epimerase